MRRRDIRKRRKAVVLIVIALMLPFLLGYCAFAIDLGYIIVVQTQLQTSADAAALAAAGQMIDVRSAFYVNNPDFFQDTDNDGRYDTWGVLPDDFFLTARVTARDYVYANPAGGVALDLDMNLTNDVSGDLVFGRFVGPDQPLDTSDPVRFNSVRVTVRRDDTLNGDIPLFFGRLMGWRQQALTAVAQASYKDSVTGVAAPPPGEKSSLMPFAISKEAWDAMMQMWRNGTTDDQYSYNESSDTVSAGSDGIPEINMFPGGGQTSTEDLTLGVGHVQITSGNFGTLEIGGGSSSTSRLVDQVLNGPTEADFNYHGGSLDFNNGPFNLNADPGISAGMESALEQIVGGETRTIFLYDRVGGRGSTTIYRLVDIVSIRVLTVELNGGTKAIWVQPAPEFAPGAVDDGGPPDWSLTAPPALTL